MSLPNNRLTTTCVENDFLDPDSIIRATRTIDYEKGGVALNNPSQGLRVKNWVLELVGNDVTLYPQDDALDVNTLFSEAGITEVSLAFDQNMQPVVGYIAGGVAKLRWFNAGTSAYVTTVVSTSAISIFLTLDDKRKAATEGNLNDVLVFYATDSNLYYRQQRDLYATERNPYTFSGTNTTFIRRAGFLSGYRVGVEMYDLPSLPECGPDFIVSVNGTSPLTGASVTVSQQSISGQEAYKALQSERCVLIIPPGYTGGILPPATCYNTLMTTRTGTITASSVNLDRTQPLTGVSATVLRGTVTVPPYPNLSTTTITNIEIPPTAGTARLTARFFTNGTFIARDQNNAVRINTTWIDTTQTNYDIASISSQYRIISVNVFLGPILKYTYTAPPATLDVAYSAVIANSDPRITNLFEFQVTIGPTTNNPRYGEAHYYGTHRVKASLGGIIE